MMEGIRVLFADVEDPRSGNAQRHDLLEMLTVALCAVLSGAKTSSDIARFGEIKLELLRRFLVLECKSAWGHDADRRRNVLRQKHLGRSDAGADLHP